MLAVLALLAVLGARLEAAPANSGTSVPLTDPRDDAQDEPSPSSDVYDDDDPAVASPYAMGPHLPRVALAELEAARRGAPRVSAVVQAAYRAAGLGDDPGPSWRTRTRLASLIPVISVHDGRDATWNDSPDPTIGYISVFGVSASWHLERLIVDPNEIHIATIDVVRRRDRRRVATVTIRMYFTWLHLHAAAMHDERWTVRADEATAELDALTDGWFTRSLTHSGPP